MPKLTLTESQAALDNARNNERRAIQDYRAVMARSKVASTRRAALDDLNKASKAVEFCVAGLAAAETRHGR